MLGESFSGAIAIETAATNPRVAGLILASSFARHPLPTWLSRFTWLLDPRWIPTRLIVAVLLGAAATPTLKLRLMDVLRSLPAAVLRARAEEALRVDKRDRLATTTCPILCLHGSSDRLIRRRQIAEILRREPTASCAGWKLRTCCWPLMPTLRRPSSMIFANASTATNPRTPRTPSPPSPTSAPTPPRWPENRDRASRARRSS
ncbi:hypothetical protein ACRAVF_11145 [Bradyrhizobium oligotrophicum S58]